MIVKNEERNIEQALSWGKQIMYEQIVVDTGSTDNTVALAKQLGATVYHFPWIDDFSAAKNFAIEQASGDWIAFLDADEYLSSEHAQKLMDMLPTIDRTPAQMIRSKWIHLDSAGHPFSFSVQDRFFRNDNSIRYKNRIHEQIFSSKTQSLAFYDALESLSIMHTGYSEEAYASTNKRMRNIEMLEKELLDNPCNYDAMSYLADALAASGQPEAACTYYRQVVACKDTTLAKARRVTALVHLMRIFSLEKNISFTDAEFRNLYQLSQEIVPTNPDINYCVAKYMMAQNKFAKAASHLEIALKKLDSPDSKDTSTIYMIDDLQDIYIWLAKYHYEGKNYPQVIQYSVLALRLNRYLEGVLGTVLLLFKNEPGQSENPKATYDFLSKLYDFSSERDQLFVYKCARIASFYSLEDLLFSAFSPELKQSLIDTKKASIPVSSRNEYFVIHNKVDAIYDEWMKRLQATTAEEFVAQQKEKFALLKANAKSVYNVFPDYFQKYSFWGNFNPDAENYEVIENRAAALISKLPQFGWLYANLADYRSKMVLSAIVRNWTDLDFQSLKNVTETHACYFDPDLIPDCCDEVFVDIGAYIGDTVMDFISMYGNCYKQIYCYEITDESLDALRRNTMYYDNISIRGKGVGKGNGFLYITEHSESSSANVLKEEGDTRIETVTIDSDIEEPITFIKMDIEGGEQDALLGCRETIQAHHPKLAISVYHNYEDIWKIPQMIHEWNDSYKFYLRYYGGDLIPTKIVLYAL